MGTQTKITNAASTYWQDNPLGLWRIGFIQFTAKAKVCKLDFIDADCLFMNNMTAANGTSSQNLGYPLIYTGDEIFGLTQRGLVSIRYRLGADGTSGGADGPRYILCPVHEAPEKGNVFVPGQDIIQAWPTHLEFQPPNALVMVISGAGSCRGLQATRQPTNQGKHQHRIYSSRNAWAGDTLAALSAG